MFAEYPALYKPMLLVSSIITVSSTTTTYIDIDSVISVDSTTGTTASSGTSILLVLLIEGRISVGDLDQSVHNNCDGTVIFIFITTIIFITITTTRY